MEFLKNITEKTLLIIDTNLKSKILEELNKLDRLVDIKIMSNQEFMKHYFFDYDNEAVYYLTKKYDISVKNAKIYLENLTYCLNSNLIDEKITFLKEVYNDLIKQKLLIIDDLFKEYLKTVQVIVFNSKTLSNFSLKIYDNLNAKYISIENDNKVNNKKLYHFKSIEEECAYVFDTVSSLIKKGIEPNHIKLVSLGDEYLDFLKRFSKFYNLKINNLEKRFIYGSIITKQFLELIETKKSKDEILEYLKIKTSTDIYELLFSIMNNYYFVSDLSLVVDLIKEDLKKATLKSIYYQNAIELISLNSNLLTNEDYVFVLGFNMENIPNTYKDIDYFDDNLKEKLGLQTTFEKNKIEHEECIYHLKRISNLIITYKDTDPYKSYYPSNLIEELELNIEEIETINETSSIYNRIKLTNNLDNMLKYGTINKDTSRLYNTYPSIPYLTYMNQFTGIETKLSPISLSYTSLNTYYHCSFRYYIDYILKLNIYEDTFKVYIGNLFHFILSKIFDDDFNFEQEFSKYIKDRQFSKKELFYLEILKEELKECISIILYQHKLSGLNNVKLETEINLDYENNYVFKGIIDKIMYKEKDNSTYISLIDYKTGTPKINMTNLIYGIDMQLPIYAYLIKKINLFLNPKIVGFYLQQIVHEKSSYDPKKSSNEIKKDKFKLNGYTINDEYLVGMFDETYLNSELIKGMKITSKGFSYYTKIITEDGINNLVEIVDKKIKEAFQEIHDGNFSINPKVIGGENVGCCYCKYKDLCFKTGKDLVYLKKESDLSYLERGEENA